MRKPMEGLTTPFIRPAPAGKELEYIQQAIQSGHFAGDGAFTERCERWLVEFTGCKAVLLTHSCTAALELACILLDIGPGDEVVMPSFTFASTANAVLLRGGTPVFVDIRADTLNIDEELIEPAITSRTKSIIPVHYAGVSAEMERIQRLAKSYNLSVIEDAAQALGSRYEGHSAGTFGKLAAFSFHETKNTISGEGGALAINDSALIERAEIVREKGTNRKSFLKGDIDKYTWIDIGSSFLPSELVAAFLFGQLEQMTEIQVDRLAYWNEYKIAMTPFLDRGLQTVTVPSNCEHNGHIFYIILPSREMRDELMSRMKMDGIETPFHYIPLHSAPAGLRYGRTSGNLIHTEDLSARLVRLPLFPHMGRKLHMVIERVTFHLDCLL